MFRGQTDEEEAATMTKKGKAVRMKENRSMEEF